MWGCFGDYPSGTVIGSDIQRGLFVVTPDVAEISFSLVGEIPRTVSSVGQELLFDIDLLGTEADTSQVFVSYNDGTGAQEESAEHLGGAHYRVMLPQLQCPGDLSFRFGAYDIQGELHWGDELHSIIAEKFPAVFFDNFEENLPWLVEGSAGSVAQGAWMHGWPVGDGESGDPLSDYDGSGRCYLTGNGPGYLDVDGEAILISPAMDATGGVGYVSYARWFSNTEGPWAGTRLDVRRPFGRRWRDLDAAGRGWSQWRRGFRRMVLPYVQGGRLRGAD